MITRRVRIALAVAAFVVAGLAVSVLLARGAWLRLLWGGPGALVARVPPPAPGTVATPPGLKVAFIGDTGARAGFEGVLKLIAAEGAHLVVHSGDALYDTDKPHEFWAVVDKVLGHSYPYFLGQGNHDVAGWPELTRHALEHARSPGIEINATDLQAPTRHIVYQGLSLLFLGESTQLNDPSYIVQRLSPDPRIWKICSWHKNQKAMQVGGKGDETGWGVYESCRQMGAMIQTAHEHSYSRTKTLTSTVDQTTDPRCSDPANLCVRPGAVPVFVSGLGGQSVRDQKRCLPATFPYGCKGEWASIYTRAQAAQNGALFIVFHHAGDPRRAHGTFKNVAGATIDEFDLRAN